MPEWFRRNWPGALAVVLLVVLAGAGLIKKLWGTGTHEGPGRPVFTVERVEVLSDALSPDDPATKTLKAKFFLKNSGDLPALDFLFIPSFGGTESAIPDGRPSTVPPGQGLEASTAYSRPEAASMSPVEVKARVTYASPTDRYTQEWFFVYRPDKRTIEAVNRPVFVIEGAEVAGDETDPQRPETRTLRVRFILKNSGNLPAEDILFVPSFGGVQSRPAERQPATVSPGAALEVKAAYNRLAGAAAAVLEIKASLNYRHSDDHYTQEWFFIYRPEKRAIEAVERPAVFVVEKVQVLNDGPSRADPSKRALTVRFSIRNTGDRTAEGFTLMPSFDGREAGEAGKTIDVAPGQTLDVTANYQRDMGEAKTSVEIKVRLGYSYAGERHEDTWTFLYHADRKAIELSEFKRR